MAPGALESSQRIVVCGPSCSGKSTLAARLGEMRGLPFVELDALFWRPNWVEPPDDEFRAKLIEATAGDRWVVAGNYLRHTMPVVWPRAETVVWLDFGLPTTTYRVLRRSWRRWRTNELLWGTNREKFWPQLKVWDMDSLVGYNIRARKRQRGAVQWAMDDRRFGHLEFVQLRSPREVAAFVSSVEAGVLTAAAK